MILHNLIITLLVTTLSSMKMLCCSEPPTQQPIIAKETGQLFIEPFPSPILKAEELMDWKMYDLAIPAYTHAIERLAPLDPSTKKMVAIRIAQIHLLLGQPEKALKSIGKFLIPSTASPGISVEYEEEINTLRAIAHIQLNQPKQAISLLNSSSSQEKLLLALAHSLQGDYDTALSLLEVCYPDYAHRGLARVIQAKVSILKGDYHAAYERLKSLHKDTPTEHALYPEVVWLMGVTQFQIENYSDSYSHFKKLTTLHNASLQNWYPASLVHLTESALSCCDTNKLSISDKICLLNEVHSLLDEEMQRSPQGVIAVALAKILLTKNTYLPSEESLAQCKILLENEGLFTTQATQIESLLLKAQTASTYEEREKHLKELTTSTFIQKPAIIPYGWLLRGHNEREEAYRKDLTDGPNRRKHHLQLAMNYYQNAHSLFEKTSSPYASEAIGHCAQIASDIRDEKQLKKVYGILSQHTDGEQSTPEHLYQIALIATHLYNLTNSENYLNETVKSLKNALHKKPDNQQNDKLSLLLGKTYFLKNSFQNAEAVLITITESSPLAAEAYYWCGRSAEKNPEPINSPQTYYHKCSEGYPSSPFAAEASFRLYTYQDYLHGDREARKHLEEFINQHTNSQYVMDAHFLLGLDTKRDRKNSKGKWINKSNLTKAIDIFQEVNNTYERLIRDNLINESDREHYRSLTLRASLEQALCNLSIARQSSGAKKHIYLEYAEEAFKNLLDIQKDFKQNQLHSDIYEEAIYGLGQTYLEAENHKDAEIVFNRIIDTYRSSKVTRGYYLSRAWHDLALISMSNDAYEKGLDYLSYSEDCAKGRVLSTDQNIDLWLKMSLCHKMLGQYDQAMRYLTKAIDEDAVSSLRLKAMFLRAEIYGLQGRHELARKQLEATSKKGGVWGQKAKDKLGELYGYH